MKPSVVVPHDGPSGAPPDVRVQRARSSASPAHSPLTRWPPGGPGPIGAAAGRGFVPTLEHVARRSFANGIRPEEGR